MQSKYNSVFMLVRPIGPETTILKINKPTHAEQIISEDTKTLLSHPYGESFAY